MSVAPVAPVSAPRPDQPLPVQKYARIAGVLLLITLLAGAFGEMYVPGRLIVATDATATVDNLRRLDALYRLSFVSYLVEALCDVALSLVFLLLLRPVHKNLALFMACLGLVSTALYAVAELFYFTPPLILGGAEYLEVFSTDQLNALVLLSLRLYARVGGIFMVFYGTAAIIRGYLVFRSGFLPKALGVVLMVAGVGFVLRNVLLALWPAAASDILLLPMFLAITSMMSWLLIKGVDVAAWERRHSFIDT